MIQVLTQSCTCGSSPARGLSWPRGGTSVGSQAIGTPIPAHGARVPFSVNRPTPELVVVGRPARARFDRVRFCRDSASFSPRATHWSTCARASFSHDSTGHTPRTHGHLSLSLATRVQTKLRGVHRPPEQRQRFHTRVNDPGYVTVWLAASPWTRPHGALHLRVNRSCDRCKPLCKA